MRRVSGGRLASAVLLGGVAVMLSGCRPAAVSTRGLRLERAPSTRHALVIGNARYQRFGRLANPVHDALAMHQLLARLGYEVEFVEDGTVDRMRAAFRNFASSVAAGDTALIYYSGHGVSVGGGNYLVPVEFNASCDEGIGGALTERAVSMSWLINELSARGSRNILLFDACRNNPCAEAARMATRSLGPSQSVGSGLALVRPAADTFIAFASADGSVADDGVNADHSPFAAALLRFLPEPRDLSLVIRDVRNEVLASTDGHQNPWVSESLRAPLVIGRSTEESADVAPVSVAAFSPATTDGALAVAPIPLTPTAPPIRPLPTVSTAPVSPFQGAISVSAPPTPPPIFQGTPPRYVPDFSYSQPPFTNRLFFAAVPMRENPLTIAVQSPARQWAEIAVDGVPIMVFGNGNRIEATVTNADGVRAVTLVPPRAPGDGILQLHSSGLHRLTVRCFDLRGNRLLETNQTELTFSPQDGVVRIPCN